MRDVAVVGIGMNDFGELWKKSLRTIWAESAFAALADAGVDSVDLITIGCMSPGLFVGQEHLASVLADELGMAGVPASRVESACASGGLALRTGFAEVASGLSDTVLVTGVEKMTDVDGADATYALGTAADQEWEGFHGITFPGLYAMLALAHMERYGTTSEQLAAVAVKNHANGLLNPHAQYHLKVSVEDVLESTMVADPLHLFDCSPVTDGAAAVVLTTVETGQGACRRPAGGPDHRLGPRHRHHHPRQPVRISPSSPRSDWLPNAPTRWPTKSPEDLHVVEVHDCFTIAEVMATEAIGLFDPGYGATAVEDGLTSLQGKIPVNPSGGLKSKGHPVGATGVAQAAEIVTQLRGEAGQRQVEGATVGLAQNMGGSGGSSTVHIMEVVS